MQVGRKEVCARTVNGSEQLSYWCSGTLIFVECSSMLNVAPVANAFLSYTWLGKCFFSDIFFSTSWLHFYFTGYLIMYWWKRSLWWQESLQGNEDTRRVSEFCLFKGSFCWAIKWIECLIFHFLFTLQIKQKKKIGIFGI